MICIHIFFLITLPSFFRRFFLFMLFICFILRCNLKTKTMNANELRHNNYAYECYWCNETGIFKNTIIQIRDVLKSHVVDVFDNAYNYEDINPILLTEELLLKCGFKYDTLDWLYLRRKRFNFNTDRSVNMGVVYVNINNRDLGLEIKHLHELQNLYFALTQKELKVNL